MSAPFCPRRVLVGTHDRGIHVMRLPGQVADRIGLFLHSGKDAVPDAGFLPTVEPGRDRGRWAIARGHVGPRRTRAQDPEHAVHNRPIVVPGAAAFAALGGAGWRKQRLQPSPLGIGLCQSQIGTPMSAKMSGTEAA